MSGVRGATWEVGEESGGLDPDASSTALTTCFGQRCTLHDIVDTSRPLSLSSPPPDLRHKINIALRRRLPAAEVSEASEFYSDASGEPSSSQTTPPDLIDSSTSTAPALAHEGKTTYHPNVGEWTWTRHALRSIRCASFARRTHGGSTERRKKTDAKRAIHANRERLEKLQVLEIEFKLRKGAFHEHKNY